MALAIRSLSHSWWVQDTYSFKKDGAKIVLMPFKKNSLSSLVDQTRDVVSKSMFARALEEAKVVCALVVLEENEKG